MKNQGLKISGEAAKRLAYRRHINMPRGIVPPEFEAYNNLAIAIVKEMLKEYRHAENVLKKHPRSKTARKELDEAMEFFNSDWCTFLTGGIDGNVLVELYKKEYCR